jgi:hypothetical protein
MPSDSPLGAQISDAETNPNGPGLSQGQVQQAEAPAEQAAAASPVVSQQAASAADQPAHAQESVPVQAAAQTPLRQARPRGAALGSFTKSLPAVAAPLNSLLAWLGRGLRSILVGFMPEESMFTIPATTMALIAIAVPVVVVMAASAVYIQRGLAAEYEVIFGQAQTVVQQAAVQEDPALQRQLWHSALEYVEQARSYQETEELRAMRDQAQEAVDRLDLIKRPSYGPAIIGGLSDTARITRMVIADDDLYMLDSSTGSVLRGRVTSSRNFEIDRSFQCGPGFANGALLDIAPTPTGMKPGSVIMAMDAQGSMVFCFLDSAQDVVALATPVTAVNWGSLLGFTLDLDLNNLFVLDPIDRAVWAYWGSNLSVEPEFFFGDDVPNMDDVIDLVVDKRDLYLLHKDGSMTVCAYSSLNVSPTRCVDPAPYMDSRSGLEGQPLTDVNFSQVIATQPPDPSLYLLEPDTKAIYHLSLRTLTFHRKFLPPAGLPAGAATAFAVDGVQRTIYLAVNNQVYQASLP